MADIDVNKCLSNRQDGAPENNIDQKTENATEDDKIDTSNCIPQKFTYFDVDDSAKKDQKISLQAAFEKFRKDRQECAKEDRKMRKRSRNKKVDSAHVERLRVKFVEQAKKYFGVPYAKKYWAPNTPEYNSPIFLDCCGLVRQVLRDLSKEFGFKIGPWNQAYMFDTLPMIIEKEENMRPGDLVFMSGLYTNKKNKKQRHNMTHVEIWYGEGPKTIGSRWNNGKVQIFNSYRFEAKSFHSEEYYFRSIDTWLRGICKSFCPQHPWRRSKHKPGKKSIFKPEDDVLLDEDEKASGSDTESESNKKKLTVQCYKKMNVVDLVGSDKVRFRKTKEQDEDLSCKISQQDYLVKNSNVNIHHSKMAEDEQKNKNLMCESLNNFQSVNQIREDENLKVGKIEESMKESRSSEEDLHSKMARNQNIFEREKIDDEEIIEQGQSEKYHHSQKSDVMKVKLLSNLTQDIRPSTAQDENSVCYQANLPKSSFYKVKLYSKGKLNSIDKSEESEEQAIEKIEVLDGTIVSSCTDQYGGQASDEMFLEPHLSEKSLTEQQVNKSCPLELSDGKLSKFQVAEITYVRQQIETVDSKGHINHEDKLLLKSPRLLNVTDPNQEFNPNTINMSDESTILYPSRRVIANDSTSKDDRCLSAEKYSNVMCENREQGNKVSGQVTEHLDWDHLSENSENLDSETSDLESFDYVDSQNQDGSINSTSFTIHDLDIDSDLSDIEFKMADTDDKMVDDDDCCGDSAYDDDCSSNPSILLSDSDCHCASDYCLQDAPAFQGLEVGISSITDEDDCHTDLESGEKEDGCFQDSPVHQDLETVNRLLLEETDNNLEDVMDQEYWKSSSSSGTENRFGVESMKSSLTGAIEDRAQSPTQYTDMPVTDDKMKDQMDTTSVSARNGPLPVEDDLNQSNSRQLLSAISVEQRETPHQLKYDRPLSSVDAEEMNNDNESVGGNIADDDDSSTAELMVNNNPNSSGHQSKILPSCEIQDADKGSTELRLTDNTATADSGDPRMLVSYEIHGVSEILEDELVDGDTNQSDKGSSSKDCGKPSGGTRPGYTGEGGNNKNIQEKGKRGGGKRTGLRPTKLPTCCLPINVMSTFYIGGGNGVALVEGALLNMGWKRIIDKNDERYKLKWVECKSTINYQSFREGEQLVNHIPNCHLLTNKLGLVNSLQEYERVTLTTKGRPPRLKMSDILPETYKLDDKNDRETFLTTYKDGEVWICKPTGMNQGKGIFLLRTQQEIDKLLSERDEKQQQRKFIRPLMSRIVQRYIHNPLLLDGRKFDIRAYMLIASTTPYLVVYHKGYVRLSCMPYDGDDTNLTTHLTNQYIQKKDPNYKDIKEDTAWSMDKFNDYINEKVAPEKNLEQNWVYDYLTKQMQKMMLHCFNSVKHRLQCKLGYFDLYGLDFMVDTDMKVWMIEINVNPSLSTNCEALKGVIPSVVEEAINISVECFEKSRKHQILQPINNLRGFTVLYCGSQPNALQSRSNRSSSPYKESVDRTSTQNTSNRRGVSPSRSFVPRMPMQHHFNPVQSKSGSNQESDSLAKSPYSSSILPAKQLHQTSLIKSQPQVKKAVTESKANSKSSAKSSDSNQISDISNSKSSSKSSSDSKASSDSKSNLSQSKNDSKSSCNSPKSQNDSKSSSAKSSSDSVSSSAKSSSDSVSLKSSSDSKSKPLKASNDSKSTNESKSTSPKSGSDVKTASLKSGSDVKTASLKTGSNVKTASPKSGSDVKTASLKSGSDVKTASPKSGSDVKAASPKSGSDSASPKSSSDSKSKTSLKSTTPPSGEEVKLKLMHKSKMDTGDRGN